MEFLISVISKAEAILVLKKRIDILDIKNPKEGSLGANFPWVTQQIVKLQKETNPHVIVSATLGDWHFAPGSAALAAHGLACCGVDCIKVGLYQISNSEQAYQMMSGLVTAVKSVNDKILVVACGYADYKKIASINYDELIGASKDSKVDICMLDTAIKEGKTLFDNLTVCELDDFVAKAHRLEMRAALTGSLDYESMQTLSNLKNKPDILGIRGLICSSGDRNQELDSAKLDDFLAMSSQFR